MDGHNEWLTDLFGCCADESYHTEGSLYGCFPLFFPRAFSCPCGLFGRVESLLENEIAIDCCLFRWCLPGVGAEGLVWCICAAMCNFCLPLPMSPAFGCVAAYQRWRIMDQFNIDGGCCEILKGCCYPCALYQHFIFLDTMKRLRMENMSVSDTSLDSGLLPSTSRSRGSSHK